MKGPEKGKTMEENNLRRLLEFSRQFKKLEEKINALSERILSGEISDLEREKLVSERYKIFAIFFALNAEFEELLLQEMPDSRRYELISEVSRRIAGVAERLAEITQRFYVIDLLLETYELASDEDKKESLLIEYHSLKSEQWIYICEFSYLFARKTRIEAASDEEFDGSNPNEGSGRNGDEETDRLFENGKWLCRIGWQIREISDRLRMRNLSDDEIKTLVAKRSRLRRLRGMISRQNRDLFKRWGESANLAANSRRKADEWSFRR